MHSTGILHVAAIAALGRVVQAQFPPTPEGITVLQSHVEDGVTISYKEVIIGPFRLAGSCLTGMTRMTSARLRKACEVTRAMSTFQQGRWMTLAYETKLTRSTHSSGFLSRERIRRILLFQYG